MHIKEAEYGSILYQCSKGPDKSKSKVMFNLTKRQLICFGMAVLIGVPSFF